jgi:glycosyltransferase involved in cell wall biosynthesis
MKILCVIDCLASGGAQRQLVELSLGFKERGHEIFFLTYHHSTFYNSILENSGITITCIQEKNYLKRLFRMRRFIRQGAYDSVLSFLEAANFICEISGFPFRKWKLVVGERSANPNVLKSLKLRMYRWFHFFADYVVANSYANMEIVRSINPLLPTSKCKVIYNVVDFNRWKPSYLYIPRKEGKLKLIIAASHQYLKNLDGLVEAIAQLSLVERSQLVVEWYGDCNDNSLFEAMVKIKDLRLEEVISFFPATHEIARRTQEADAVGLFSFYEGFPNAVCEGMACGKPVICSAVSDVPLFLGHSSKLLCAPVDHRSIRDAMRHVLSLSCEDLVALGKQNTIIAKQNFDKGYIVTDYLELLEK